MRKTGIRFLIAILLAANLPVLARENLSDSALTADGMFEEQPIEL